MEQKLMELLLEVAPGIDPKEVKMESRLQADLGLDSMSGMLLLMEIEDTFQIELEDTVRFETVGVISDRKTRLYRILSNHPVCK